MEAWFWILGWCLSILTITGNGFIIFLVSSKRQLRTKTNAFVVSLAVADFCVGMSVVPSLFICVTTSSCEWPRASPSWAQLIRWLFMDASVTNLCSLVLDRYMAVVKPMKYLTFMTHRRVVQMISFSWVITVVFILFQSSLRLSLETPVMAKIFIWLAIILFELLPCVLLIFCFVSMVHVVYKHNRSARTLTKQLHFNHCISFTPNEKTAVVMMAIVVGLFLVCYGFYLHCGFLKVVVFSVKKSCNDSSYTLPLVVLNSAVNPLAYALFKRDIKREFKRLLRIVTVKKYNKVQHFNKDNSFTLTLGNSSL